MGLTLGQVGAENVSDIQGAFLVLTPLQDIMIINGGNPIAFIVEPLGDGLYTVRLRLSAVFSEYSFL